MTDLSPEDQARLAAALATLSPAVILEIAQAVAAIQNGTRFGSVEIKIGGKDIYLVEASSRRLVNKIGGRE